MSLPRLWLDLLAGRRDLHQGGGKWKYLFRAVDKYGVLIDFMVADRRNTRAAHHFLSMAATTMRDWLLTSITTDLLPFILAEKRLIEIHTGYEDQPEYRLDETEDEDAEVSFRLERMKLSKDKASIRYNDFLSLKGIPAEAFEYRLGNRSALE